MPAAPMNTPRTHQFTVKQTDAGVEAHTLEFYDWGPVDDPVPIICVHGLTRNAHDFDWIAAHLSAQGRRVIAISMAGRGMSAALTEPLHYTYATYVGDVLSILDNFHWRQVDWIGTSMGGIIGMSIATLQPARIRKLVLNDIGATLKKQALERIFSNVRNMPSRFTTREEGVRYLREAYAGFGLKSDSEWEQFARISLQQTGDGGWRLLCDSRIAEPIARDTKNYTEISDISIADLWKTIRIPTLVLRGALSDILDIETVNAMRATNLQAEWVTIENVGHAPALMDPFQIQLVSDWLLGTRHTVRMAGL